ncbi:amino acid adenylation domain-containing protein [Enterococcus larvae]|uniref:amino acid adenylation domain-containing protein n=1 Tax=Enterococcus larvae TaxID=2794352 RepID=UPI003F3DA04D
MKNSNKNQTVEENLEAGDLNEKEKKQILKEFNNTKIPYPKDKTIHSIFEEQVNKTPGRTAVVWGQKRLNYEELNNRANQLAQRIKEQGVMSEDVIGIIADRSIEMILGMLAVLKNGCAYLPIDPRHPNERKQFLINDSQVDLLLVEGQRNVLPEFNGTVFDLTKKELYIGEKGNLISDCKGDCLAYIMYTSGSTGQPKGVMIEHHSVLRLVIKPNFIQFEPFDCILQTGAVAFDASTFEIWGALLNGLKLCLATDEVLLQPEKFVQIIEKQGVTIIWLTSSLFNQLSWECPAMFKGLRYLLVGGEELSVPHIERVRKSCPKLKLINGYGPTENTTFSLCHAIDKTYESSIPIGKPISNSIVYIVGKKNQLQPIGKPGEIVVGGSGVARGYVNNQELTAEKFIDDPFATRGRLYRTGDLGRWLPDGTIEYLGRIDNQVKIRGFRIEPREIEAVLLTHEEIREAVVFTKTDQKGSKYLCASLVLTEKLTAGDIRKYLSANIPNYMIPIEYREIAEIPLTLNGKANTRILAEAGELMVLNTLYEEPESEKEELLVKIWQEVLGIEQVGIRDNFFEMGGDSLKAMTIISNIHKVMEIKLDIREVFNNKNIKQLADYLIKKKHQSYYSIEQCPKKEFYEASSVQKRMFTMNQMNKSSINYNLSMVKVTKERLNKEKLEYALLEMHKRHESLRTSFHVENGIIVQKIAENIDFNLEEIVESHSLKDKESIDLILEELIQPFDLARAPLLKAAIVRLKDADLLFFDIHHIVFDGLSQEIFMRELAVLYNNQKIMQPKLQYKDFAKWQNSLLEHGKLKKQEDFWLKKFESDLPDSAIFTDYPPSKIYQFIGNQISFCIPDELRKKIIKLIEKTEVTPFMLYLSAFTVLLSKYTMKEDVVVGMPVSGRVHPDLRNIIGAFVNTLVQRNYPVGDKKFIQFLKEVQHSTYEALENQDYPFEKLIEKLKISTEDGKNPLFNFFFTMQNFEDELYLGTEKLESYNLKSNASKLDIAWIVEDDGTYAKIIVEYNVSIYKKETIERMIVHYSNLLTSVVEDKEIKIKDIEIIGNEEKQTILNTFNNTAVAYERNKTVVQLFEECAAKDAEKPIVVSGKNTITYKELNERANQLAHYLRKRNILPNQIIGVMCDRSIETIVAMLGVIKSGAAYIPIDVAYPVERIIYMLEDSNSRFLLSSNEVIGEIYSIETIFLNDKELINEAVYNPITVNKPTDIIYVMYTSGSTGRPKGVCIAHRGVVRLVNNNSHFKVGPTDKVLSVLSPGFDPTVLDIWGSMLNSVPLVLVSKNEALDVKMLKLIIDKHNITSLQLSSPLFTSLALQNAATFNNVKNLIVGGDTLSVEAVNNVVNVNKKIAVTNAYGPTENTVTSTQFTIDHEWPIGKPIPIGRPISNSTCYIMDKFNKLQPIGIPGEICLGGDGVAKGYLNRESLTKEKFINNEYVQEERIYKTGDLGKWLPDGNIEFIGRVDDQVKIRGFRVEISEIEKVIKHYKNVKDVVVVAKKDTDNDKFLCAYIVADKEIMIGECRNFISQQLAEYMIPQYLIQLKKIPLTINGKVDIKSLPEPESSNQEHSYRKPRTELQTQLAAIWSEALKLDRIGIDDNFFWLGGHSLKAIGIISKIYEEIQREISLTQLFSHPTIRELSKFIELTVLDTDNEIVSVKDHEYYKVSPQQLRVYTLQQYDKQSVVYNTPVMFMINGVVNVSFLKNAINELVKRHELLRTSFHQVGLNIVQKINDPLKVNLETITMSETKLKDFEKQFVRPFKLEKAPLIRTALVHINAMRHILFIDMHHIISDGQSINILIDEMSSYYKHVELGKMEIQYKDYIATQQNFFSTLLFEKQEDYWMNKLKQPLPVIDLPTDYERPSIQSFRGSDFTFEIDEEMTLLIKDFLKKNQCTLHMLFITVFHILLSKYSGQEDIVIGTVTSGRFHRDLNRTVGMFVNTLPIRNQPMGQKRFLEFLNEVKTTLLEAFENERYPFEKLVDRLKIKRDISRNLLFDVMVTTNNVENEAILELNNQYSQRKDIHADIAKFDLSLDAKEYTDRIELNLNYCIDLFRELTVSTIANHFLEILCCVISEENILINCIELSTANGSKQDEEYEDMLDFDFNFD